MKNGVIINGVKYQVEVGSCNKCDLKGSEFCKSSLDRCPADGLALSSGENDALKWHNFKRVQDEDTNSYCGEPIGEDVAK